MAKKPNKSKSKSKVKYDPRYILCHPSTWIAAVLALALLVIYGVAMYGFNHIEPKSGLDIAKLEVFDHVINEYVESLEITNDKPTINEVTGYGISDEDGVFYVTFDFVAYEFDEGQVPNYHYDEPRHGILYFWKDDQHRTYSHAFSYHDDYYHPGGIYVEIGEHYLRDQLAPNN